jgi:predicted SnoaL-like aldol condensation-catalyzing enzyme
MEPTPNKSIIAGFYRQVVRERKSELIPDYVHEHYIQHNPMGKDGRQGLFEMVEFLKTLPPSSETDKSPVVHLIEEGDLVVAHLHLLFIGKNIRVIELFRVQDGKATEHWDVTEEQNSSTKPLIEVKIGTRVSEKKVFLINLYAKLNIAIHRIISEGDLVAVHAEAKDGAQSIALFDIFQLDDGRLAGHWGVRQPVPDRIIHGNGMF